MLIGIPIPDQDLRVASEYVPMPPKKRGFVPPRATVSAPSIAEDHGHALPRVGVEDLPPSGQEPDVIGQASESVDGADDDGGQFAAVEPDDWPEDPIPEVFSTTGLYSSRARCVLTEPRLLCLLRTAGGMHYATIRFNGMNLKHGLMVNTTTHKVS